MAFETIGVRAVIEGLAAFERASRVIKKELVDIIDKEQDLARQNEEVRKGLRNIGLAMVAASGASAAFLFSATRLAARVETLGIVTETLGRNVGMTKEEMRALEQAIVSQGITLRISRTAIALMIQANIDLAKGTELARLAQDAAVIGNLNSSDAFQRLVFVISSANVRMARTLGLQVSFQGAYKKTADAVGKAVTELTEQEKINARTNVLLDAGARIAGSYAAAMDTAGKKVLSLDRHLEESRRILGEAFLPIFADVVDKVTEGLKAFQDLDTATQRQISTGLAMGTVWVGLIGGAALFVSAIVKIKTAIQTLALAMNTSLGPIGLFLGLMAAITTAVVAQRAKLKELRREFNEQADVVQKTANTYEEYEKAIRKAAEETDQIVITQEKWNSLTKKTQAQLTAHKDVIILASKEQFILEKRVEGMNRDWLEMAAALGIVKEETEDVTDAQEELDAQQERLQDSLSRLKDLMREDITKGFIDWKVKTEELTATIEELESKEYLTAEQKAALEETRGQLEETTKAWRDHTANVIFNLAEQALAIDGLTEEEILALAKLQERLGLVDEGFASLTEEVLTTAGVLSLAGDQSDVFVDELENVQDALLDSETAAEDLAESLRGLPTSIIIDVFVNQIGGISLDPGVVGGTPSSTPGVGIGGGTPAPSGPTPPSVGPPGGPQIQFGFAIAASSQAARFANSINTLVTAIKAAPLLAMPAPAIAGSTQNNSFNMNIHTSAPREPIIQDFRTLEALSNAL